MNKLMGFFELQSMTLPSIPWKEYTGQEILQDDLLWTIRSAVFQGDDLNLPRLVGATAKDAKAFADRLLEDLKGRGIVIFYPFFLAQKSGTLEVRADRIVIEAVREDLWNMVTLSKRDVTVWMEEGRETIDGDEAFLSQEEKDDLLSNVREIRKIFRGELLEGKSVLLEWSFAQNCNVHKVPMGERYLVFYEARTL